MVAPPPEEVYTLGYWGPERGHSTIDEQVYNVDRHEENGKSKSAFVLERIKCPSREIALEIGCAPGIMLKRLQEAGFQAVNGIEAHRSWFADIKRIAEYDHHILVGFFPEVTAKSKSEMYDLVLGLDVFEHSHKPWPFIAECARLLKKHGQLLLMAPLVTEAYPVPERMFNPSEHVWIHAMDNVAAMLWQAGFHSVEFDAWTAGHECVSAIKGDMPEGGLRAA